MLTTGNITEARSVAYLVAPNPVTLSVCVQEAMRTFLDRDVNSVVYL